AGFPFGEIVVLSALAKGADTLCAEAAIETGCTLIAPLPLTAKEYRKDFDANDLPVFERLLAAANDYFPIPSAKTDHQAVPRTYFYSQLGHYIISHCHLLLALWDGDERDIQPGGTADVVRMALEGLSAKTLDKAPLSVIQLVTPKEGAELPQNLLTFNRIPEGRKI
ncbi:MAG: hypothetical protein LBQ78_00760, partial [Tannerellaceae bacterium]|nr:hypothetical protein [Tannerellaceae bacterium]